MTTLRRIVKDSTGFNLQRCQGCMDCAIGSPDEDIPLGSVIQLALMDDDECLTCRTLWSEDVFQKASLSCNEGLNLQKVLIALRTEARKRGVTIE